MLDLTTTPDPYKSRLVNSMGAIATRNLGAHHAGRTASGRFTRSWLPALECDDFSPDSKWWERQARASLDCLGDMLTPLGINQQVGGLIWPDSTIQRLTWRTIREMAEAAIAAIEDGKREPADIAEAAHERLNQLLKETV